MDALSAELLTALAPILCNEPDNPVLHLMAHFRDRAGLPGSDLVSNAFRQLQLCSTSGQFCEGNIMQAFSTLGAGGSQAVSAGQFMQLLTLQVAGLPQQLEGQLMQLFGQLAQLPPDYATFRMATKACLLLQELGSPAQESPSEAVLLEAEARKLLGELLQQRQWFAALEPLPTDLRLVSTPAHPARHAADLGRPGSQPHEEGMQQVVEQLAALAKPTAPGGGS